MNNTFNLPDLSVTSKKALNTKMSDFVVHSIDSSDFKLSVEDALSSLCSEISLRTIILDDLLLSSSENGVKNKVIYNEFKSLGISANPELPIDIDIKRFVNPNTEASWLYMCKIDVNVYLSAYESNYGDALAIPIKGMQFLNTENFNNIDSSRHCIAVANGFNGTYTCFDEKCQEVVSTATNFNYLYDTRLEADPERMYKWCAVYRCDRDLNCNDKLSAINIKYMSLSNRSSKVINTLSGYVETMDFCFSDEPFVINKDYDYFFVLHNKYVENLSSMYIFLPEAMSSVTYFRCSQYQLKDPGANGVGNKVNHGNAWIGWNSVADLSAGLSAHDMDWVWHSLVDNSKRENAHGFVGPMNLIMDKDQYTLLNKTIITKNIADSIYANKSYYSYDNTVERIGQLKIHEYSSDEKYNELVTQQNKNELYIVDQPDGINMYDNVIKNVADPEDESDAATKGYVDSKTSNTLKDLVKDIDLNMEDIDHIKNVLTQLITNIKNI